MKLEVSLNISHTLEKLHVGDGNPEYVYITSRRLCICEG